MSILNGKKVIIIGDRDGIPGEAIKACVETVSDAEVLFAATECFVWTAAGAMDLENQKRIKEFVEKFGGENIVILLGAAITRFFGFEGMVHIREGSSSNSIITLEEYVNIHAEIDGEVYFYNIPVRYNPVTQTHFNESITLKGKPLTVKFDGYHKGHGDNIDTITLTTSYNNVNKQITIPRSYLDAQLGQMVELGDAKFSFVWGPSQLTIPFKIYLEDFIVTRYPGSKSPSSYKSIIKVENSEDNTQFDYEIFMNNVLDYKGYRFFQSSYDPDEQGTILSVNKDPGKIPTYLGYFLLTVGFVWSFFGK